MTPVPRASNLRVVPPSHRKHVREAPSLEIPQDRYGLDPGFVETVVEPVFDFLFQNWFRVEVSGLENVPREGRALLVANHSGALPWDALMIYQALRTQLPRPRSVRFLVDHLVMRTPFVAMGAQRAGFVLACRDNARRLLREEELVGVFPEGTKGTGKLYRDRYRLARFGRGGFAEVALETRAPIVPVAVVGAEETHPILFKPAWLARALRLPYIPVTPTLPWLGLLGLVPIPSKFYIHFDRPMHFKAGAEQRAHDFTVVNALNKAIRIRITRQIQRMLAERPGVF